METSTGQTFDSEGRAGQASSSLLFREPRAADGAMVHDLIAQCPPLDPNSLYCNLLQCSHFAGTCVIAEIGGKAGGWISGYIRPDRPDTLFIWQVAVAPEARGRGLGRRMIRAILERPACRGVTRLETTITESNDASWALFRGLAHDLHARFTHRPGFEAETHFAGRHATEHLVEIGSFRGGPSGR
ncbi:MAG: diaminobutyrate acetyltransferase [Alphaproteobacteria bacterium]|nr:diaminobutyrate acetyltransferase [Alphaproteobacteria bacterium]